jgi:hypothetical protein
MTHPSKSCPPQDGRRLEIGCVIPAKAGIQFPMAAVTTRQLGPGLRRGDG